MTKTDVDELEAAALAGDRSAITALAAAARDAASETEPLYRVETADGLVRVVTAREYLSLTATDLTRAKIEMIRG